MEAIRIRTAREGDLPAINAIYNHYVLHSTTTYQIEPETEEGRRAWFASRDAAHPVIVAEMGEEMAGWGSLSPYHARAGYGRTVEDSIYVRHDLLRRGIGSALLAELIARARALGHHTIIAGIDAEQPASIALHERFGFVRAGHPRQVGRKFGRWLDVIYMQLLFED